MLSHVRSQLREAGRAGIRRQHAEFIKGRTQPEKQETECIIKNWWDDQGSSLAFSFNFFVSRLCFHRKHVLFYSQERMHAVFKRMEEKGEKLAGPDGAPIYPECGQT